MSEPERYEDPVFAARVRAWVAEAAPPHAPDRLVGAVMRDVEAAGSPRRRPGWGLPRRLGPAFVAYAGLTVVIAVGVALGIAGARLILPAEPGVGGSSSPSTPAQTAPPESPSALPTASALALEESARFPLAAHLVATGPDAVWITVDGPTLVELDPLTGARRSDVPLPATPVDVAVGGDAVWVAFGNSDVLRVDAATRSTQRIPGTAGGRIVATGDSVWVGSADVLIHVDAATRTVLSRVDVQGHGASLGFAVDGSDLWVATNTRIAHVDATTGTELESVPGDGTDVVLADGVVWATRGGELVRIDPPTLDVTFVGGLPVPSRLVADGSRLWVAQLLGFGSTLVEIDASTGTVRSRTPIAATVESVAAANGSAWIAAPESGTLRRFAAS